MPHDLDDLGRFGISAVDELVHPVAPDEPFWNESVFYDWIASPTLAGHVRIGRLPNQGRAWLWVFLLHHGEWIVLEEPRLPIDSVEGFDHRGRGLRFAREVVEPLRSNRLTVSGVGRVVSGERAGRLVPFDVDVVVEARGPAHSLGESTIAGHSSALYASNRFEQPVAVRGSQTVDGVRAELEGQGERDHSWGPRYWNMEWFFLVVHGEARRFQCARVVFDEDSYLSMGYLGTDTTRNVVDVDFDLRFDDASVRAPYSGRVRLEAEDGSSLAGELEVVDGCEIDASHAFEPPQPSLYRRAIVRFRADDGGEPLLGWLEINRFPKGMKTEETA